MKQPKRVFLLILLFTAVSFPAFPQTAISFKVAIPAIASDIGNRLQSGTRIAVVNFASASQSMNEHALGELIDALSKEKNLVVVGRDSDLQKALDESDLNQSPDFDDESAQRIGRLLGAQMVVYGSLRIAGEYYRLTIRVLEVQTAVVPYSESLDILNDRQARTLMGSFAIVQNFTPGERAGTAVLNLAFGLGSFTIEKDPRGGGLAAALEGIGAVAVAASFFLVGEKVVDYVPKLDTSLSMPFFVGGLATYAGGAIYGVFRALSYQKPGVNVAMNGVDEAPLPWTIALVPGISGKTAVRLNYTLRF